MRRIRYYVFKAGTKLPFAELPALIHQFLDEQGLKREQPGFSLFLEKKRPISSPLRKSAEMVPLRWQETRFFPLNGA